MVLCAILSDAEAGPLDIEKKMAREEPTVAVLCLSWAVAKEADGMLVGRGNGFWGSAQNIICKSPCP